MSDTNRMNILGNIKNLKDQNKFLKNKGSKWILLKTYETKILF